MSSGERVTAKGKGAGEARSVKRPVIRGQDLPGLHSLLEDPSTGRSGCGSNETPWTCCKEFSAFFAISAVNAVNHKERRELKGGWSYRK